MNSFLNAGNARIKILENIFLGEADGTPAEARERRVFLPVFLPLDFGGVSFAVVALNGDLSLLTKDGEVYTISLSTIHNSIFCIRPYSDTA